MTTDLSTASIPTLYRDLYDRCSTNGEPIHRDLYQCLLNQCQLDSNQLRRIWELAGPSAPQGSVSRTNFYKTLALVAWAQQGKDINEKLFDSFTGQEYPTPTIRDLSTIATLKIKLNTQEKPSNHSSFNYLNLTQTDTVNVQLVPEKKGLFLKHSEYIVSSKRFQTKATRRYNDFLALHELLLNRFPYRLVPNLPPKKIIMSDSQFLEERRRGLQIWLTLVCRHPMLSKDSLISFFLTDQASDLQTRIRNAFRAVPDEFMTSDVAANAKELLPSDHNQIAMSRECIQSLVNVVGRIKMVVESNVERSQSSAKDIDELANQFKNISSMYVENGKNFVQNWRATQNVFGRVSKELGPLASTSLKHADLEQSMIGEKFKPAFVVNPAKLTAGPRVDAGCVGAGKDWQSGRKVVGLLLDILIAHKELCERLEKGLAHDHQVALSKMLSLKKKKLQGAIRGADAESVEQLEARMLAQENVISNIDLRTDFSLYCVYMETQLIFTYLATMPSILASLIDLRTKSHFELLDLWRNLQSQYCQPLITNSNTNYKVNGDGH